MRSEQIEEIEIALLLDAIRKRYGYDFRNYARASLRRRLRSFAAQQDQMPLSRMIPAVLQDESFGARLIHSLSVTVSEMFRDPAFYAAIRERVIPYLKTYPFVRIWHAGCATGEEVYSLAIVLQEEDFYDRTTIFATDVNEQALHHAREAIYPLDAMKTSTTNYQRSGGRRAFSDYYRSGYDAAILDAGLKRNVTIANHNLVTDGVFSEVHLVLCRNVLIYFDQTLQNRVLGLFNDSLVHGGILALGSKETLQFSRIAEDYKPLSRKWKIYQKTAA